MLFIWRCRLPNGHINFEVSIALNIFCPVFWRYGE